MEKHVKATGILWIAFGTIGILTGIFVAVLLYGIGFLSSVQHNSEGSPVLFIVGTGIAFIMTLISIPGVVGGFGVYKKRQWGRIVLLILAGINLMNIPIGTALGIYTFWSLLSEDSQHLFS